MYRVEDYGHMIADRVRMPAYEEALRRSVKPGSVVVDIGCGTGIFSVLACQLGARHVYAIEPDDSIQVAKQFATATGCADRITFLQEFSTRVTLPERADVIVSDLRGILPMQGAHFRSLSHAREQMLKPGGVLIPQRDTLFGAVVTMPETFSGMADCWELPWYPFRMDVVQSIVTSSIRRCSVKLNQLLTSSIVWGSIDYRTVTSPNYNGSMELTAMRDGVGHGLALWFDAELIDGVGFSNAPGLEPAIYGRFFFPWTNPVELHTGDIVHVEIHADLLDDDYLWRWNSRVVSGAGDDQVIADLKQSTFHSTPLSLKSLQKRDAAYLPKLSRSGEITRRILQEMHIGKPLQEVAQTMCQVYPEDFPTWEKALGVVGDHAAKFCE